jgi:hypothetical protein
MDAASYSIVEFQFIPSIMDSLGFLLDPKTKYSIKIETPPLVLNGVEQILPTTILKLFSLNEKVVLFLLPSDSTVPTLKYKVSYFKIGERQPLLIESWVVPQALNGAQFSLKVGPDNSAYDLPANFWEFKSLISGIPLPEYSIANDRLNFAFNPPETQIQLLYTGKYTRADVVWPHLG